MIAVPVETTMGLKAAEVEAFDTEHTDEPTCPHCGDSDIDWSDGTSMRNDGDEEVRECQDCGKLFRAVMYITWTFDTYKTDALTERKRELAKAIQAASFAERYFRSRQCGPAGQELLAQANAETCRLELELERLEGGAA